MTITSALSALYDTIRYDRRD